MSDITLCKDVIVDEGTEGGVSVFKVHINENPADLSSFNINGTTGSELYIKVCQLFPTCP